MKRIVVFVVAVMMLFAPVVRAQEPTPEPGPGSKVFPKASTLGKGWVQIAVRGLDAEADLFSEGDAVTYGGPHGSQVTIFAFTVTTTREATRQAWESASGLFDTYHYQLNYDYSRDDALSNIAAPEGCAEVTRTDGEGKYSYMPAAVTLCAADPDKIVLAVVIGGIDGVSDYSISDWVAGITISGKEITKPSTPAPAVD